MYYTVAFVSSRKRKVFNINGFDEEFQRVTRLVAHIYGLEIKEWSPRESAAIFTCSGDREEEVRDFVSELKRISSSVLRKRFPSISSMPSLWIKESWIREYPPSENDLSDMVYYIDMQRSN